MMLTCGDVRNTIDFESSFTDILATNERDPLFDVSFLTPFRSVPTGYLDREFVQHFYIPLMRDTPYISHLFEFIRSIEIIFLARFCVRMGAILGVEKCGCVLHNGGRFGAR